MAVPVDLGSRENIPGTVEAVAARFGTVDILVNNAGTTWGAPAEDYPAEAWDKVMRLNIDAMFFLSQEVGRRFMIPRRSGKIVNVASVAGLSGNPPGMTTIAYNASKGAAVNLTRALAAEWGRHDINVNAICPGFFPSKMTHGLLGAIGDAVVAGTPLGPARRRRGPEGRGGLPGLARPPATSPGSAWWWTAAPRSGDPPAPRSPRGGVDGLLDVGAGAELPGAGARVHAEGGPPARAALPARRASRRILPELRQVREKARETGLFAAHMPPGVRRRPPLAHRVRPPLRGAGEEPARPLLLQRPGAGHREHGADPRARHRGAEGALARAARPRRDPQLLHHDRAGVRRLEPGLDGDHRRARTAASGSSAATSGSPPRPTAPPSRSAWR